MEQERKQEAQAALVKAKEALAKDPEKESLQQQVMEAEANKDSADKAYAKAVAQRNAAGEEKTIWDILENILLMLVTDNLFKSAAEMSLLPLIVFSIIFAAMLTTMGDKVFAITRMINQANAALMSFVMLLMNIAPIGIFCLVASKFGEANLEGKLAEMAGQQGFYICLLYTSPSPRDRG